MNGVGGKEERQLIKEIWLDDIQSFKAHYGCLDCLHKDRCHECFSLGRCIIVDNPEINGMIQPGRGRCEGCPYGNGTGTCFGFCIRAILNEYRIKGFRNGGK